MKQVEVKFRAQRLFCWVFLVTFFAVFTLPSADEYPEPDQAISAGIILGSEKNRFVWGSASNPLPPSVQSIASVLFEVFLCVTKSSTLAVLAANAIGYANSDFSNSSSHNYSRLVPTEAGSSAVPDIMPSGPTIRSIPVVTGNLPDLNFTQGSGDRVVKAELVFRNVTGGIWFVTGAGATITQRGRVTIPDDTLQSAVPVTVAYKVFGLTVAQSSFNVTVEAATTSFNPEDGLKGMTAYAPGMVIPNADFDPQMTRIAAFDVVGLDVKTGALFREHGGGGVGDYFGVRPNGTGVLRAGNGQDDNQGDLVIAHIAASLMTDGTYVEEMHRLPGGELRVRLWKDGVFLVDLTSAEANKTGLFGGDDGAYLRAGGSGSTLPTYGDGTEESSKLPVGTFSDLRVYTGQQIVPESGSVALSGLPATPQNLRAIPMAGALSVHFSPSTWGGIAPMLGYEIEVDGVIQPDLQHPAWYSNLVSDGVHRVRVRGVNTTGGKSPWSNTVSATVDSSLPPPMVTTLSDTVSFNGVTLTLDRP
ncbi:hypothetical protein, partial [uncultured Roseobacter sp.]|uniref:hypothetical protein n=1 Tax=uncultured Roseobacter sp. TaxID=114847 RepID=UPI0026302EE5